VAITQFVTVRPVSINEATLPTMTNVLSNAATPKPSLRLSAHRGPAALLSRRVIDLILFKTYAELKSEAQRTYIGVLWWLIEPIIFMSIFYFLFGVLFRRGTEGFVAFLLVGLAPWHWIQATTMQCSGAIIANYPLINQVFVPKFVFPTVILLTNTVKFLVVFLILLLYLSLSGDGPSWIWLQSFVVLGTVLLMIAGCGYLAAAVTPMLPDIRIVIDNVLRALFYFSGIFFEIDSMPETVRKWMNLNPFAMAIGDLRMVLIQHETPPIWHVLVLAGFGVALAALGLTIMRRYETRYAKLPV
jgi:lipopolysaccharide transport system permease protein